MVVMQQGALVWGEQMGICNGVQDSGCPGNIRKYIYIGCPHPYESELGDGTAWSRAIKLF